MTCSEEARFYGGAQDFPEKPPISVPPLPPPAMVEAPAEEDLKACQEELNRLRYKYKHLKYKYRRLARLIDHHMKKYHYDDVGDCDFCE